ncbi:MAG: hypothetical protein QOF21_2949 [Actinomycetota bacterium]
MTYEPYAAGDVAVVIPTMPRWDILNRTLDALAAQTTQGFETIVVVDQRESDVPASVSSRAGVRVLFQDHGGPGKARNTAVAATDRRLVLMLGDDMIPEPALVERHLAAHNQNSDASVAVLGHVDWHPDVADSALQRWMDWSGTQFDYDQIDPSADAGFGRFFSCNVSVPRSLYEKAGGFDESFVYYYEDLDFGWRLDEAGMRLRYEPSARALHLHAYDWAGLQRRFDGIVIGERMMAAKHDWFEPWFKQRMLDARSAKRVGPWWPKVADLFSQRLPAAVPGRNRVRKQANLRYHQQLAPRFVWQWEGLDGLDELKRYLGDSYDETLLHEHETRVEAEEEAASDEATFYRTSNAYLYDLTAFGMWDTKVPYFEDLRAFLRPGSRVLDYGCGIGTDGLRLINGGHHVGFADFDNPSVEYLRWRLEQRGLHPPVAEVYDIDDHVPGGFDLAYSFDVIEHVEDPPGFMAELEARADIVAVNLLEPDPNDVHLHKPLPIPELLDRAERNGILRYRKYHGRSHLVIYRAGGGGRSVRATARSVVERRLGANPRAARLLP